MDLISGYFNPISTNHFFGLNRKNVPTNIGFIVTPRIFYDGFRSPITNFCENLESKKLNKLIEYMYSLKRKSFIYLKFEFSANYFVTKIPWVCINRSVELRT